MSGFKGASYPAFALPGIINIGNLPAGLGMAMPGKVLGPFPVGDTAGIAFKVDGTDVTALGNTLTLTLVWSAAVWVGFPLNGNAILDSATGIEQYVIVGSATTILTDYQTHRGPYLYILAHNSSGTGPLWSFNSTFTRYPVDKYEEQGPPVTNPVAVLVGGAAASATWTIPTGQLWEPQSIFVGFTTSATVGSRELILEYNDGTRVLSRVPTSHILPASLTRYYTWARGLGAAVLPAAGDSIAGPLPQIPLRAGWTISVFVQGGKAGDAFINAVGTLPTLTYRSLLATPIHPQ